MLGISVLRNKNLADIFYRLRLIEAYGIGVPKIHDCYAESNSKPSIEITDNAFKLTLPNMNYSKPLNNLSDLSEREIEALKLFKHNEYITRAMMEKELHCSQTTAIATLNLLADKNLIKKTGKGKNTKYKKLSFKLHR